MLQPVQRRSLSEAVYEQLRQRIVSGELQAGSTLPAERILGEVLGVNRGAVREALKRLEQAGLVSIQHGGATRVLDYRETGGLDLLPALLVRPDGGVRTKVVRSVMEMRSALAPDIAARAAGRADGEARRAIAERGRALAQGDALAELQQRAMDFWAELVRASDNVAYTLAYNALNEIYDGTRDLLREVLAPELRDAAGYAAIADAVQAGDGERARAAAEALLRRGAEAVAAALDRIERREREDAA